MATSTAAEPISWDEYMSSSYSPDREYVNGMVVERNVGKGKHSYTQGKLTVVLTAELEPQGLLVLPEQRTRVAPLRARIPDVSVVRSLEDMTQQAPVLCIEILSPEDRWNRIQNVIHDYQEMGAPCVWVVDPWARRAWIYELDGPPVEVLDGKLAARHLGIEIALDSVLPPPSQA